MSDMFRQASEADKALTDALSEKIISIYWDGNKEFFEAKVLSYDVSIQKHKVLYFNDDSREIYEESLNSGELQWKIWTGTKEQFDSYLQKKVFLWHDKTQ